MYLLRFFTFITQVCFISAAGTTFLQAETYTSYLTSPNYPNYYGRYENERWIITTLNSSHVVRIDVEYSSIESSSNCIYDYVSVYDGPDASQPLLSKFCGYSSPTLESTRTVVLVNFVSDGSVEGNGFRIRYWSSEPGEQSADNTDPLNAAVIVLGSIVALAVVVIVLGTIACCCSEKNSDWCKVTRHRMLHVNPARDNSVFYCSYSELNWPDNPALLSRVDRSCRQTHRLTSMAATAPPYESSPNNNNNNNGSIRTSSFNRHSGILLVQPMEPINIPNSPPPPYTET